MSIWEDTKFWYNIIGAAHYNDDGEALIPFEIDGEKLILHIIPIENNGPMQETIRFNLMNKFDFLVTFEMEFRETNDPYKPYEVWHVVAPEFKHSRLRIYDDTSTVEDIEHIMTVAILSEAFGHVSV